MCSDLGYVQKSKIYYLGELYDDYDQKYFCAAQKQWVIDHDQQFEIDDKRNQAIHKVLRNKYESLPIVEKDFHSILPEHLDHIKDWKKKFDPVREY